MGILVKPEDAPRLRSGIRTSGAVESPPGTFPTGRSVLGPESPMPQGQQEGAEMLSGGQRQPSGNGQSKGCGPASPEGVRVCLGSVACVWAAGTRGRGQAPSQVGDQEARGLIDLESWRGCRSCDRGGRDATNAGLPQGAGWEVREGSRALYLYPTSRETRDLHFCSKPLDFQVLAAN